MANELAEIRKELEAIRSVCGTVQEVVGIRSEVDSITRTVGAVRELVDIRKEVEAIRKEKDDIVKQFNANKSQEASKEAPKVAPKAEKKPEAKKEESKTVEKKPETRQEPAKPVADKKPEAKKEAPKPVEKRPEAKKEAPKPVEKRPEAKKETPKPVEKKQATKEEPKPVEKKAEAKKETPKAAAPSPVAAGQPPKEQQWGRGDLLSSCCEGYYNLVRQDKTDVNWVLLKHESNTKVRAEAVGTGGLSEVIPHLSEKDTAFIYMRFHTGDAESKRAKFVLFSWCGARAPIMRKAKMSVHKADVKQIFASSALEIHATETSDLDETSVRSALIKAGGANYNGQNQ